MKSYVMISQVTSHEDYLVGSISLKQLLLWLGGGSIAYGCYQLLPDSVLAFALVFFVLMLFFGVSIRLRHQLVLEYLFIWVRFVIRPKLITDGETYV